VDAAGKISLLLSHLFPAENKKILDLTDLYLRAKSESVIQALHPIALALHVAVRSSQTLPLAVRLKR